MKRLLVIACFIGVALSSVSANDQRARVLMQAAEAKAKVEGDLNAAIKLYKDAEKEAGSNRALVAQALVKMAEAYRALGDAEAQKIYQRLVRDFSDQKEPFAVARAQLSAIAPTGLVGDRIVASGSWSSWGDGRVSPDGRLLSYVDYNSETPGFRLQDLATRTSRPIEGCGSSSAFSPDGKQLVCGGAAVSIVNVEGPPQRRILYRNDDVEIFYPSDWSSDGKSIAVTARRKDRTRQIGIVTVADGSFRPLKTVGWRGPGKLFFSPGGEYLAYDLPASDNDTQRDVFVVAVDGRAEEVVVADTSSDIVMAWGSNGALLFASDRNGPMGLWSVPVPNGSRTRVAASLVKADIGSVETQGLTRSGTLYVVKGASTVSFQVVPIDLAQGRLTGPPVAQVYRADTPAWSPDGKRLAYMHTPPNGSPVLAIRELHSDRVRHLKPRLLYMPQPSWFPDGRSLAVWGRDLNGRGVIVRVDVESGEETYITDAYDIQQVRVSLDGKNLLLRRQF